MMDPTPWFNLFTAILLVYVAFSPSYRPMSWTRFWVNIFFAVANVACAVVLWVS